MPRAYSVLLQKCANSFNVDGQFCQLLMQHVSNGRHMVNTKRNSVTYYLLHTCVCMYTHTYIHTYTDILNLRQFVSGI
jgi:hypothetical protein